ncbi:MAG: glycosyltransferase family 4 protein [Candidatus Krumholzibacteriia bacterium]
MALLSSQRAYYGGEVHLHDLAVGLAARGHDVTCLVRPDSALADRLAADRLDVRALPLGHWYEPSAISTLRNEVRQLAPDILHTHSPRDYYHGSAATVGLPVCNVATRHQLRPIAASRLKRPFLDRFGAMIAVSEAVREGLLASGLPASQVVVVPNGVRPPDTAEPPGALRRELGLVAGEGPVVGFVGRLCPSKGVDTLLWAVSLLRNRWPELLLVLVGDDPRQGAYRQQLTTLARQLGVRASFCGYRPGAARLLAAFDLLAVPSLAEPFGLVTLEALARGVPVVATAAGGSLEIVRDGVEGLLVPPGDPEAFAQALHLMLADQSLRATCVQAGRRRVASAFSLAGQVAATEAVYALAATGAPLPARLDGLREGRAGA